MVGVEGIAEWIGREVIDRDGDKVGKLEDVYYDTTDHTPTFVAVKSGAFGRSHPVAPLVGAVLSRDYVRLDAPKELLKDAPQDASGGRLTGVDAVAVLRHFALTPDPDLDGETRVCFQTAGAADETERKRQEVAAEQAREAGGSGVMAGSAGATAQPVAEPARTPAPEPERPRSAEPEPEPEWEVPPAAPVSRVVVSRADVPDDDDDPLERLADLERRVAALEARLA